MMAETGQKMSPLIAALDDESDILELLRVNLRKAGFRFEGFQEAEGLYRFLQREAPDLILLDLMLPDMDGLDVCRHLRQSEGLARIPVIMLTAKDQETDKIVGLELGADDYVTKPFSVKELIARIHSVLRRGDQTPDGRPVVLGALTIDPGRHKVTVAGTAIDLTATEFNILLILASRRGRVFTRDQILDHLWGHEKAVVDRTIDVHIRNLREKLGTAASLIKNIRGVGYKIEE
ncbi:MAG: response regulator transcription factor [Candidatus Aminicenantales bacterium]|jgi:two-component system phosphate regulon response regulator PhoB/two-component system alkaline phosphatase synthesis response regulator PhoP